MTRQMTGAKMIVQALIDQGVDTVFGYPGGAVLPIYDEIFQQNSIKHVLVRHEQGAVHAAEGYARSTGKPGVALVTSGPGATNAVTGAVAPGNGQTEIPASCAKSINRKPGSETSGVPASLTCTTDFPDFKSSIIRGPAVFALCS